MIRDEVPQVLLQQKLVAKLKGKQAEFAPEGAVERDYFQNTHKRTKLTLDLNN